MTKKAKFRHFGNRPLWDAMQGKRGSSAAEPHKDRRTRRKRTRATARAAAMRSFD